MSATIETIINGRARSTTSRSCDLARLEQAKLDWRDDRFPTVPGDELERIPLPA